MFLILDNISLNLKTVWKELQMPSVTKISIMMLNCHTKNEFNDKTFLEQFCVKESSKLIGLENLGAQGFP